VAFLLDRQSPAEILGSQLVIDYTAEVLYELFSYAGAALSRTLKPESFWYMSPVLCPTQVYSPDDWRKPELAKLPGVGELRACRDRVLQELNILRPEIVVACGRRCLYTFFPGSADRPDFDAELGQIVEAHIPGSQLPYVQPVLFTHSLVDLHRDSTRRHGGKWFKTTHHIAEALRIAHELRTMRPADYDRSHH